MWIVSKDKKSIVNSDYVETFFIGADGNTIKANFANSNKGCQIAQYSTILETETALEMLAKAISEKTSIAMPTTKEIQGKMAENEARWHHATGKKTKGHGGS